MMFARAEDREVLAAEYALGTLDDDERVQAQALTILDPDFAVTIKAWERRFGELHVMLAPVAPPAGTWERIKAQLASTEKIDEIWLPEVEPLPVPQRAEAAPAPIASNDADVLRCMRAWRRLALLLVLIGVAAATLFVLRSYRPDLLPPELRLQVIERIVEVPVGSARPAHYVAVLQKEPFAPAFVVTFDLARTTLVARMLAAKPPAGQSYQLWMISDQFDAPRSLGVIGKNEYLVRTTIAAFDPATLYRASYGISLEPEGGSLAGKPTGAMLYTGRLMATTPVGFPEQSP